MRRTHIFLAATCTMIALAGCTSASSAPASSQPPAAQTTDSPTAEATPEPTSTATPSEISIVAGGDILLHLSVNAAAWNGSTYDYTTLFSGISDWINGADLALCALEVPIVPDGQEPSNYPNFGAPPEIATSLKHMGWDGCALATNHSMDRGFAGVESTIRHLEAEGLGHAGTARTQEEADEIQYYTLETGGRDLKIAHISATTLTNGIPIPAEHPYSWNVVGSLGNNSVEDIIADAKEARAKGAGLVVVSMHWGTEYVSDPIEEQTLIAQELADSGEVDVIFGNHSHVPEPVTKVDGGPDGQGMWVVWSMGNLISGQTIENHGYRVTTGLLTTATVSVPPEGSAHVTNLEWTAVTQDDRTDHLFLLNRLMNGEGGTGMSLSAAEIQARADATYPVMEADGSSERTVAPTGQSTLVSIARQ